MATTTTNYGLTKPSYGDNADIAVINSNMDKIDSKMKEIEDAGGGGAYTWAEVENKPFETVGSGLNVDESGALSVTGGGSGGSSVEWNQIQTSGSKIAEVTIDGTKTDVYVPTGGSIEPTGDPIKLIDAMASSEDSNGKVTCSSALSDNYAAWMAFNDVSCSADCRNGWLASSSDESPYIQYEFKNGTRCFDHISIETYNNASALTRNVTVQASNDASEWTDIGTAQIEFKQSTYNTVNVSISDRNYWKYIRLQFDGKMYLGVNQTACTLSKVSVCGYTDVTLESVNTKIDDLIALLKSKGVID